MELLLGTAPVVSTVNTPDLYARAKAYESYKVYVACEGDRIVGSADCAVRKALVGGRIRRVDNRILNPIVYDVANTLVKYLLASSIL